MCLFLDIYPSSIWATLKQKNVLLTSDDEENGLKPGIQTCTDYGKHEKGGPISEKYVNSSIAQCKPEILSNENGGPDSEKSMNGSITHSEFETVSNEKDSSLKCILDIERNIKSVVLEKMRPMFLSKNWRDLLCRCKTCEFYRGKGIDYLTDKEDSLQEYEKIAKEKREQKLQQLEGAEMKFLNMLNHVQKIEILNGISDMN